VLAGELRHVGVSVEVGTDSKLKRMLELANKIGARYALIIGDNELVTLTYGLKDMAGGEQVAVTRQELLERLSREKTESVTKHRHG
jgi:histidyl-tRNA synthetase